MRGMTMTTYSKILEKVARMEMRIAKRGGNPAQAGHLTVFTLQEVRVLLAEIDRLQGNAALADEIRTNKINDGLEAMQERDSEQS